MTHAWLDRLLGLIAHAGPERLRRRSMGHRLLSVFATCALLACSAQVHAGPSNCDGEMNEDQKFQTGLCAAHAGCRFVMTLFDSCSSVKSYVGKLGLGSRSSASTAPVVQDSTVEDALGQSGLSRANIASCLFSFDRALCRQYLGLEAAPAAAPSPAPAYQTPRKTELLDMTRLLEGEQQRARTSLPAYDDARRALAGCENAKDMRDRDEVCAIAQNRVSSCQAFREDWSRRRDTVLAEAPKEGLADLVASLRSKSLPECPSTLPGSGWTPAQALAEWTKARTASDDRVIRCDGLRRTASAALDEAADSTGMAARAAVTTFENTCARERTDYALTAQAFRQRLQALTPAPASATDPAAAAPAADTPAAPLPLRRGSGSSGARQSFNTAIADSAQRIQDEKADAERARQASLAAASGQTPGPVQRLATGADATGGASRYRTCLQALEDFDAQSGADEDRQRSAREQGAGRTTPQMIEEQRVWRIQYHLAVVNQLAVCANSQERQRLYEALPTLRANCQCQNGRNHWSDASRYDRALQSVLGGRTAADAPAAAPGRFPAFPASCQSLNESSAAEVVRYTRMDRAQALQQNDSVWANVVRYAAQNPSGLAAENSRQKARLQNGEESGSAIIQTQLDICLKDHALRVRTQWTVRADGGVEEK